MREWLDILKSNSVEQVLQLLVDDSETARRLRQSTPFAEILTQEERRPDVTNPLDDLPPKEALISLLSEAFQASLLREESRSIRCRLVLINRFELTEAEGPPTGMQVLELQDERKLSAQEIRRLSPCATSIVR